MESFFADPDNITLGVLIVDARHKPTDDDFTMCRWFVESGSRFVVLANKIDKLKKSEIESNLALIRNSLEIDDSVSLIPFSAEKRYGRELLIAELNNIC